MKDSEERDGAKEGIAGEGEVLERRWGPGRKREEQDEGSGGGGSEIDGK